MAAEPKAFSAPDEIRQLPLSEAEIVQMGGGEVGRYALQPGWRWTTHLKYQAGSELCQAPHFQFHAAGRPRRAPVPADGTELEIGPSLEHLPPLPCPGRSGSLSELGSPAASVWLFAACRLMIWGVLPPVSSGAPDR